MYQKTTCHNVVLSFFSTVTLHVRQNMCVYFFLLLTWQVRQEVSRSIFSMSNLACWRRSFQDCCQAFQNNIWVDIKMASKCWHQNRRIVAAHISCLGPCWVENWIANWKVRCPWRDNFSLGPSPQFLFERLALRNTPVDSAAQRRSSTREVVSFSCWSRVRSGYYYYYYY